MLLVFAIQYITDRISGTVVRVETTMEEASEEVQTVLHAEVPPIFDEIMQHIFDGTKHQD